MDWFLNFSKVVLVLLLFTYVGVGAEPLSLSDVVNSIPGVRLSEDGQEILPLNTGTETSSPTNVASLLKNKDVIVAVGSKKLRSGDRAGVTVMQGDPIDTVNRYVVKSGFVEEVYNCTRGRPGNSIIKQFEDFSCIWVDSNFCQSWRSFSNGKLSRASGNQEKLEELHKFIDRATTRNSLNQKQKYKELMQSANTRTEGIFKTERGLTRGFGGLQPFNGDLKSESDRKNNEKFLMGYIPKISSQCDKLMGSDGSSGEQRETAVGSGSGVQ